MDARRTPLHFLLEHRTARADPGGTASCGSDRAFSAATSARKCVPWNARAPETSDPAFRPALRSRAAAGGIWPRFRRRNFASASAETPVMRAKHEGLLRNVAAAMARVRE